MDALVQPIRESLTKVDGKLGELERTRVHAYSALHEQLRNLTETQLPQLHAETANLVKAAAPADRARALGRAAAEARRRARGHARALRLRRAADGRRRGRALAARRRGQAAGRRADRHRREGAVQRVSRRARSRPTIPRASSTSHATRSWCASTPRALGRKAYWDSFSPSPDFVVMFLPGEMLYTAALQHDAELIEAVANERVVLATPSSLIGLLRTIALGWREQALARQRAGSRAARPHAVRARRLARHALERRRRQAREGSRRVQQERGRARDASARHGAQFVDVKAATADDGELEAPQRVGLRSHGRSWRKELVVREAAVAAARERTVEELTSSAA